MATGLGGNDCPVPKGSLFGIITAQEHDAWCDCMYGGTVYAAKCKLKADIDPSTWKYIALPWTTTGKAARELPDASAIGKLLNQGMDATTGLVTSVVNGNDPFASVKSPGDLVNLVTGNTTPAGSGGPLGTVNGGRSTSPMMNVRTAGGAARAIASGGNLRGEDAWYQSAPAKASGTLLIAGVIGLGVYAWSKSGGSKKKNRRGR